MSAASARRPRRERGIREIFLSVVLVLEAIVMFFATLVAYGLSGLDPVVVLVGGAVFIAVLLVVSRLQRYRWGVGPGWVMQGAIIATGALVPLMFVVGAGFAAMWVWALVRAGRIESQYDAAEGGAS